MGWNLFNDIKNYVNKNVVEPIRKAITPVRSEIQRQRRKLLPRGRVYSTRGLLQRQRPTNSRVDKYDREQLAKAYGNNTYRVPGGPTYDIGTPYESSRDSSKPLSGPWFSLQSGANTYNVPRGYLRHYYLQINHSRSIYNPPYNATVKPKRSNKGQYRKLTYGVTYVNNGPDMVIHGYKVNHGESFMIFPARQGVYVYNKEMLDRKEPENNAYIRKHKASNQSTNTTTLRVSTSPRLKRTRLIKRLPQTTSDSVYTDEDFLADSISSYDLIWPDDVYTDELNTDEIQEDIQPENTHRPM